MKSVGVKIDRLNSDFFYLGTNAYYKFNEQSGQFIDHKNDNDSSVLVNILKNQTGLIPNTTSYRFTGNSYIEIPFSNDFNFKNGSNDVPFSIEMLFTLTSPPNENSGIWFITNRGQLPNISNGFQIVYRKNRIGFYLLGNNKVITTSINNFSFKVNKKYHIVGTYDGSKKSSGINLYINSENIINVRGSNVENFSNSDEFVDEFPGYVNNSNPIIIGKRSWQSKGYFNGKMQLLNIAKNKVYNNKEVKSLYRNGNIRHLI